MELAVRTILTALTMVLATPAAAQLTGEAFTWGAEVHTKEAGVERLTVIEARQVPSGWSVEMLCEQRRGRKVERKRWKGGAVWSAPMMLATFGEGMRVTVVAREDGGIGVVTSGTFCAQGPGNLTSGGG